MSQFQALSLLVALFPLILLSSACSSQNQSHNALVPNDIGHSNHQEQKIPALNTTGIINYVCHWPGEKASTPLIKHDDRALYCSQNSCQMSSKHVVGSLIPGTRITSIGGLGLSLIKVESGNFKNHTGFISAECADWAPNTAHLTGEPAKTEAPIKVGSYKQRQFFANQVNTENADARYYSGYKGNVMVTGKNGTTMDYYDPDTTRPEALTGDKDFVIELREHGFKKITFSNGDGTWTIDLKSDPPVISEK